MTRRMLAGTAVALCVAVGHWGRAGVMVVAQSVLPLNALTTTPLSAALPSPGLSASSGAVAQTAGVARAGQGVRGGRGPAGRPPDPPSAMVNPYQITKNWPHFGDIRSGAAIGIIPDGTGGTWLHHRSEPPILHIDAAGNVTKRFGDKMFVQAHGFCQDRDGNFWAGDSGPFQDNPNTTGRGFQVFKFSRDGKVLLTLGRPECRKRVRTPSLARPPVQSHQTVTSSSLMGTGRARQRRSRTATGSFG